MAAGSIVVDLLMRTGSFETDTKRAEKRLQQLEREAKRVGAAIGLAFTAAAGATVLLVKNSIDAADAATKQAQAVGLLVEDYTALTYAAGLSGVSQEDFASNMVRLSRQARDAGDGLKTSADAFGRLGIQVKNADGTLKDSEALLGEIADRFATLPEGIDRTAAATDLFGKSGAKMVPFLLQGRDGIKAMKEEAIALGDVIDTQLGQQSERFNDNLSRLASLARGTGNDLARELLPVLNDSLDLLVQLGKDSRAAGDGLQGAGVLASGLTVVLQALLVTGANVSFVLTSVGREIGALAAQTAALARLDISGFHAISDAVKEDGRRARAELDAFEARVMALGTGTGTAAAARPGTATPVASIDDPARAAARSAAAKAAEEQRLLSFLTTDYGSNQSDAEVARLNRYEEALAALPEVIRPVQTAQQELVQSFLQSEKSAYSQTPADIEALVANIAKVDDRTKLFLDNVQSGFGDTLYKTLKGDFDNIFDLWADLLLRMVAQAAAADFASALGFGGQGGNLSNLAGNLANLFGFGSGPGRAAGGPVQRGGLYPINEMGGPGEVLSSGGRDYLLAGQTGVVTPVTAKLPSYYSGASGGAQHTVKVLNLQGQSAQVTSARRNSTGGIDFELQIKQIVAADIDGNGQIMDALKRTGVNRAGSLPRRG